MKEPTRFRILIIGRANAGKTTILRAICGTKEEPDVYDRNGRLKAKERSIYSIFPTIRRQASSKALNSVLSPTPMRGIHDIEDSLVFPSNPGFVFHDSCGFESGATDEVEHVRNFIQHRAAQGSLDKQLHAIWYCFPTDSNRIITAAEQEFFRNIDTGKVPVIAIFTKFDALDAAACSVLCKQGIPFETAQKQAPHHAEKEFKQTHLPLIGNQPHPPKAVVCLQSMHEEGSYDLIQKAISGLIESTVASLDDNTLKLLLVLVQCNNVELCMKVAVESGIITKTAQNAVAADTRTFEPELEFINGLFQWFPYIWTDDDLEDSQQLDLDGMKPFFGAQERSGIAQGGLQGIDKVRTEVAVSISLAWFTIVVHSAHH